MKTQKELFNKVKDHLLAQAKQARNIHGGCMYRQDSLKCAVGCLIHDDEYDTSIENTGLRVDSIVYDRVCASLGVSKLKKSTLYMLGELQTLHDNDDVPRTWRDSLFSLEQKFADTEGWEESI